MSVPKKWGVARQDTHFRLLGRRDGSGMFCVIFYLILDQFVNNKAQSSGFEMLLDILEFVYV